MLTFFHGCRRKSGCVTLVLACVFAAGWVRSLTKYDAASFRLKPGFDFILQSAAAQVGFWRASPSPDFFEPRSVQWFSQDVADNPEYSPNHKGELPDVWERMTVDWRWDFDGFQFGKGHVFGMTIESYKIPYWSIVVPLTLLSAWFLLSKARKQPVPIQSPKT